MSSYTMKDMYLDSIYIRDFVVSEAKDLSITVFFIPI